MPERPRCLISVGCDDERPGTVTEVMRTTGWGTIRGLFDIKTLFLTVGGR
jgi:hypothetical protein